MIKNTFFSTITALVLIGCIGTTLNFKIRFSDIAGLRKNDQVFFDKTAIGKVTDIEYTDTGKYLVPKYTRHILHTHSLISTTLLATIYW